MNAQNFRAVLGKIANGETEIVVMVNGKEVNFDLVSGDPVKIVVHSQKEKEIELNLQNSLVIPVVKKTPKKK